MKNRLFIIGLLILVLSLSGCTRIRKSGLDFEEEYESVNGVVIKDDLTYRVLDIRKDNPYVKVTPKEIVEKIENKESFYLYVGDTLCPWCRSGLEKMIDVAIEKGIKNIYYIDFWDDNHNEILRDLYEVSKVDNKYKVVKTKDATEEYTKILEAVSEFAQDYTIVKDDKTYDVGEKRIFGGDHFYFEKGTCIRYVSLRSDKLQKWYDELTDEVLLDQETKFKEFFTTSTCDDNNC